MAASLSPPGASFCALPRGRARTKRPRPPLRSPSCSASLPSATRSPTAAVSSSGGSRCSRGPCGPPAGSGSTSPPTRSTVLAPADVAGSAAGGGADAQRDTGRALRARLPAHRRQRRAGSGLGSGGVRRRPGDVCSATSPSAASGSSSSPSRWTSAAPAPGRRSTVANAIDRVGGERCRGDARRPARLPRSRRPDGRPRPPDRARPGRDRRTRPRHARRRRHADLRPPRATSSTTRPPGSLGFAPTPPTPTATPRPAPAAPGSAP